MSEIYIFFIRIMITIQFVKNKLNSLYDNYQEQLNNLYPGLNQKIFEQFLLDIEKRILEGYPLEYLIGKKYFYNGEIFLGEGVFIPRFETEILVHEALKIIKTGDRVLDLCAGPGTIGISILREKNDIEMTFIEQHEQPIFYIKKNLKNIHATAEILKSNLFENVVLEKKYNIILTNPPYIPLGKETHTQTIFEPQEALFIPFENFFTLLFEGIQNNLEDTGFFIMEIYEENIDELQALAFKYFLSIQIKNDLTGRPRFLIGQRKNS